MKEISKEKIKEIFDDEKNYAIDNLKLLEVLSELGYKVCINDDPHLKNSLVRVTQEGKLVEPVTPRKIGVDFVNLLKELRIDGKFITKTMKGASHYFNEVQLGFLPQVTFDFLKDTKDTGYFLFKNSIVIVTAERIEFTDYNTVDKPILISSIKDQNIVEIKDYQKNDFYDFCRKITGNNDKWFESLQSNIGYLMLNNNDARENKAVIAYDTKMGDRHTANGGSGKSMIFRQALKKVRNVLVLNGKQFHHRNSMQFLFQSVDKSTNVIFFDDVDDKFDFELIYSALTEGFEIEKKNRNPIYLKREDCPKFVISANSPVKMKEGASSERRKTEVYVNNFFNHLETPLGYYGKFFFDNWDKFEYGAFYMFMFECLQTYLRKGLIKYIPEQVKSSKIRADITSEVYEFFEDLIGDLEESTPYDKKDFHDLIISELGNISPKKVTMDLNKYCKFKGYGFEVRNSGGVQTYQISIKHDIVEGGRYE